MEIINNKLSFLSKSKICDYYLGAFFMVLFYLIYRLFTRFDWSILLYSNFWFELILVTICFLLLFFIGKGLKKLFGFKTITTGIVAFFAVTFFLNMVFSLVNISSVYFEVLILSLVGGSALILNLFSLKSIKQKLIYFFLLVFIFVIFKFLPENAFNIKPQTLGDVNYFWYPISLEYFKKGFASAFINSNLKGYGLFIHHFFVVIKRFVMFNSYSLEAFSFAPKVLFFIAILFLNELRVSKIVRILVSLILICFILTNDWITQLLVNSLMGEGVAALFFAIMLNEILENVKEDKMGLKFIFLWLIMGILYITKPFISYLVLLTPFIIITNFFNKNYNKLNILKKFLVAFVLVFIGYILWNILNNLNNFPSSAFSIGLPKVFGLSSVLLITKYWLNSRLSTLDFSVGFIAVLIGLILSKFKKIFINIPVFFVLFNLALVWGLYSTFWLGNADIESSYRYFLQIFYVAFIAFAFSLQYIWDESSIKYKFKTMVEHIKNK